MRNGISIQKVQELTPYRQILSERAVHVTFLDNRDSVIWCFVWKKTLNYSGQREGSRSLCRPTSDPGVSFEKGYENSEVWSAPICTDSTIWGTSSDSANMERVEHLFLCSPEVDWRLEEERFSTDSSRGRGRRKPPLDRPKQNPRDKSRFT